MKFSTSSSSSSFTMLLCFCMLILLRTADAVIKLPNIEMVPAVLVFGDSIVDPGNNNQRNTMSKSNFPPYGRDFMGGKATGRFSNGKIPPDFVVEELGVKEVLPAYLDPKLQDSDLITGVSFASGGSGYDPLTPQLAMALSQDDQLNLFKQYIGRLKGIVGEERANDIISRSLYIVVTGSNDIINTYFLSRVRRLQYDVPSYTNLLINWAIPFFQELYGLGARTMGVFGVPPLGCVPSQRSLAGGLQRQCVEEYNRAGQLFNAKLSSALDSLNSSLPNARIVYIDIYTPLSDIIQHPQKYGFKVADRGCCGTGTIEVTALCNEANPFTCTDVTDYVFWDSYHPTQKAYQILVSTILGNRQLGDFL